MISEDVKEKVQNIRESVGDDEAAHSKEDDLYREVLLSIYKDPSNAKELAREALKTQQLDFSRWCA